MTFPASLFQRQDDSDDGLFYGIPRKVVHIDEAAIAELGKVFERVLPKGGSLLDLMSSWRSHLPSSLVPSHVMALGMNREEMVENPQLDDSVVHDLNRTPRLPFEEGSFDGVVCTVSVQYLIQPVEVFAEVLRVLKPGGPFVVSFSNRCFPQKAIALWLSTGDEEHLVVVKRYFGESGIWDDIRTEEYGQDSRSGSDPLYVVWAKKPT